MAALPDLTTLDSKLGVDKLTSEIFSILENKFLFGPSPNVITQTEKLNNVNDAVSSNGKVRILSIDGSGSTEGALAAASLSRLETFLRRKSGDPKASLSDFFDVAAGSGSGGILAALLFTRGKDGRPMFSAGEALNFMVQNGKKMFSVDHHSPGGLLRWVLRLSGKSEVNWRKKKILEKVFGDFTLKDTVKSVLITCYDLSTHAPFLFSRADALEMDGYDFKMSDVCLATSADPTVEMNSVDGRTRIVAVDGGIAMSNPTAAAITHVLNNKMEFPTCKGVEDLVVVSLGNGEAEFGTESATLVERKSHARFVRISEEGASDMVDQAVSMAFGQCRGTNYVRIQANGIMAKKGLRTEKQKKCQKNCDALAIAEEMLVQKNVESVLFQGKKVIGSTNLEKLEAVAGELVKEKERRKTSVLPTVVLKLGSSLMTPRTSSASTLSSASSSC